MKWISMLFFTLSLAAHAENEPSVLVKTQPIRKQPLAIEVSGYGSVMPGVGGESNINFAHAGRVLNVDVTPGQRVKIGQVLLALATDPAAVLGFEQAKSTLELAKNEFARVQILRKQQLATNSQYDNAARTLKDAESAYAAQRKLGNGVAKIRIRAPFDGVISRVSVAPGARIAAGTSALQLIRSDAVRVRMGVEPEDSVRVKTGMPVLLASVFDESQKMGGVVEAVHGMLDPQTQLVDVLVRIDRDDVPRLIPGMRISGIIRTHSENAWAVPRSAVLRDGQGAYIFQNDRGRAKRINVRTGLENDGWIAVTGDFDARLPVVVLGNYELHDGMLLREQKQ
ncbi:MAG: efflux RND transporter periplasmic adaptor subunit [Burkholderiales bacterium]